MQLILCSVDRALTDAWQRFCGDLDFVRVHHGSILEVRVDAVLSPANSFGFMDGGIDALYLTTFGRSIQQRLQSVIATHHQGELLVGRADLISTGVEAPAWLIAAPTMRVPMILEDTVNPYLAARGALLLVRDQTFSHGALRGEKISEHVKSVAIPGLGTGVGRVPPSICAHQVRAAIDEVLIRPSPFPHSWAEASERHQLLYTDRPRRLQFPKECP